MSIRRTNIDRINEARKSARPTIGRGKPLNAQGDDGDLTFRRTSDGLKLYIKAAGKWNGVKVGESFDDLEKTLNNLQKIVSTIKQFRLPSTYSVTGDFTLDVSGDIELNADGGDITFKDASTALLAINQYGDVTATRDIHSGRRIILPSGQNFYLDGGGDTYIYESAADDIRIVAGGDILLQLSEAGTDGNTVYFRTASAGFQQLEPTFDATDTEVDFRHSNKQKLTLTADITDIHFQFPDMSGNFLCVLLQDGTGSWDITNWKTKDAAGNAGAGNSGVVLWAGGDAPGLTETADKADIVSIYWDADNEIAYGTATVNF